MEKKADTSIDGLDVVGIVLVTLKIIGVEPVVNWSWWLVLAPWWIYIGALAYIAFIAFCAKSENEKEKEKN